jgi:hypothetical protein
VTPVPTPPSTPVPTAQPTPKPTPEPIPVDVLDAYHHWLKVCASHEWLKPYDCGMYFRNAEEWWKHRHHDLPTEPHEHHGLQLSGHGHHGQGDGHDGHDGGGSDQGSNSPWWLWGLIALPKLGATTRGRSTLGLPEPPADPFTL